MRVNGIAIRGRERILEGERLVPEAAPFGFRAIKGLPRSGKPTTEKAELTEIGMVASGISVYSVVNYLIGVRQPLARRALGRTPG